MKRATVTETALYSFCDGQHDQNTPACTVFACIWQSFLLPRRGLESRELNPNNVLRKAFFLLMGIVDMSVILVLGGCCANAWTYEALLDVSPHIGSALTFSQMLFIALMLLPAFVTFSPSGLPRLKPRAVPLRVWAMQVILHTSGSLLNNWSFAFDVPLSVIVVIRSGGLAMSMVFGRSILGKRYSRFQVLCVLLVSAGVVLTTLACPALARHHGDTGHDTAATPSRYTLGVSMLLASVVLTTLLGVMQEHTYTKHGAVWREAAFYMHLLSLPMFVPLANDISRGFYSLALPPVQQHVPRTSARESYLLFACNLATQFICFAGVNRLSSRVSSVETNLVLTARKALSLCFSVWWFGRGWSAGVGIGAVMVFLGSILYGLAGEHKGLAVPAPKRIDKRE